MIAADTSVWVAALRDARCESAGTLTGLLDADEIVLPRPVRIELLAGASKADRTRLKRSLSALPVVVPTDETWSLVEQWSERAANAGQRFGLTDLLIGALAEETGALLWSLDADFRRMARLRLVQLYE